MKPNERQAWSLDQIAKSEFFHQKLHLWGVLEVANQIEAIKGETLKWDREELGVSTKAWDKVIHRGIKPIVVFAHPSVLTSTPRAVSYYLMLAIVSQKSMNRVGVATAKYENATNLPDDQIAWSIARHLNKIISRIIESDTEIDPREFDLWRGMAAGSQAQGSWQNAKGNQYETLVKDLIERRLTETGILKSAKAEEGDGLAKSFTLIDERVIVFADEPDVAVFKNDKIITALEIKGGIDMAGVLERVGAAIKSLSRAKSENSKSKTVLLVQSVSLTPKAKLDLKNNKKSVNHWLTIDDVLSEEQTREKFFAWLGI